MNTPFLRNIVLATLLALIAMPTYLFVWVFPTFNALLVALTEDEAQRISTHLANHVTLELGEISAQAVARSPDFDHKMRAVVPELGLLKLRLFDANGQLVYSTAKGEAGRRVNDDFFMQVVAKGKPWSKLEYKGGKTAEGESVTRSIVETYIPIMKDSTFQGAFEVYFDISESTKKQDAMLHQEAIVILLIVTGLVAFLIVASRRAGLAMVEREKAIATVEHLGRQRSQLLNAIGDGVYGVDLEGKAIFINPAALQMVGRKKEEVIGHDQHLLFHHHHADGRAYLHADCPIRQTINDGQERHIQSDVFWRADGQSFPVEYVASPLINQAGQVEGGVIVFRDISERLNVERAMQRATEAAEQANNAKSMFLANMSHEIRTPLNAVIGLGSLLEDTPLNDTQREFVNTIRTSSESLLVLINDILDYSKIEAGQLELEEHPFDLLECIDSALELVALRASANNIVLHHEYTPGLPHTLIGDITRLRQVLVNLLSNAVKFTEQGDVTIGVTIKAGTPGAQLDSALPVTLEFFVRDSGIGIPKERQVRLFKSFSQIDASTTRKYGGTGLGLAISQRITALMGGTMWVESEGVPGMGSTFRFTMNVRASNEAMNVWQDENRSVLKGKHLLAVDDHPGNLQLLTRLAEKWEMPITTFNSVKTAIQAIEQGIQFDATTLDMNMPDGDGVQIARSILISRKSNPPPALLLSSIGKRLDEADKQLFTSVLSKPIRANALFDALVKVLNKPKIDSSKDIELNGGSHSGQIEPTPSAIKILLVDDNAVNQKVGTHLIAKLGYQCDLASNGLEALSALRSQHYDIVLMDVQMPEMDGFEATRHIVSEWPKDNRPYIIAMTANAMEGDKEACISAGMNDYVAKPIRIDLLRTAILAGISTIPNKDD